MVDSYFTSSPYSTSYGSDVQRMFAGTPYAATQPGYSSAFTPTAQQLQQGFSSAFTPKTTTTIKTTTPTTQTPTQLPTVLNMGTSSAFTKPATSAGFSSAFTQPTTPTAITQPFGTNWLTELQQSKTPSTGFSTAFTQPTTNVGFSTAFTQPTTLTSSTPFETKPITTIIKPTTLPTSTAFPKIAYGYSPTTQPFGTNWMTELDTVKRMSIAPELISKTTPITLPNIPSSFYTPASGVLSGITIPGFQPRTPDNSWGTLTGESQLDAAIRENVKLTDFTPEKAAAFFQVPKTTEIYTGPKPYEVVEKKWEDRNLAGKILFGEGIGTTALTLPEKAFSTKIIIPPQQTLGGTSLPSYKDSPTEVLDKLYTDVGTWEDKMAILGVGEKRTDIGNIFGKRISYSPESLKESLSEKVFGWDYMTPSERATKLGEVNKVGTALQTDIKTLETSQAGEAEIQKRYTNFLNQYGTPDTTDPNKYWMSEKDNIKANELLKELQAANQANTKTYQEIAARQALYEKMAEPFRGEATRIGTGKGWKNFTLKTLTLPPRILYGLKEGGPLLAEKTALMIRGLTLPKFEERTGITGLTGREKWEAVMPLTIKPWNELTTGGKVLSAIIPGSQLRLTEPTKETLAPFWSEKYKGGGALYKTISPIQYHTDTGKWGLDPDTTTNFLLAAWGVKSLGSTFAANRAATPAVDATGAIKNLNRIPDKGYGPATLIKSKGNTPLKVAGYKEHGSFTAVNGKKVYYTLKSEVIPGKEIPYRTFNPNYEMQIGKPMDWTKATGTGSEVLTGAAKAARGGAKVMPITQAQSNALVNLMGQESKGVYQYIISTQPGGKGTILSSVTNPLKVNTDVIRLFSSPETGASLFEYVMKTEASQGIGRRPVINTRTGYKATKRTGEVIKETETPLDFTGRAGYAKTIKEITDAGKSKTLVKTPVGGTFEVKDVFYETTGRLGSKTRGAGGWDITSTQVIPRYADPRTVQFTKVVQRPLTATELSGVKSLNFFDKLNQMTVGKYQPKFDTWSPYPVYGGKAPVGRYIIEAPYTTIRPSSYNIALSKMLGSKRGQGVIGQTSLAGGDIGEGLQSRLGNFFTSGDVRAIQLQQPTTMPISQSKLPVFPEFQTGALKPTIPATGGVFGQPGTLGIDWSELTGIPTYAVTPTLTTFFKTSPLQLGGKAYGVGAFYGTGTGLGTSVGLGGVVTPAALLASGVLSRAGVMPETLADSVPISLAKTGVDALTTARSLATSTSVAESGAQAIPTVISAGDVMSISGTQPISITTPGYIVPSLITGAGIMSMIKPGFGGLGWPGIGGGAGGEAGAGARTGRWVGGVNVNFLRNFFFEKVRMEKPVAMRGNVMLSGTPTALSVSGVGKVNISGNLAEALGKNFNTRIVSNTTPFEKKSKKRKVGKF